MIYRLLRFLLFGLKPFALHLCAFTRASSEMYEGYLGRLERQIRSVMRIVNYSIYRFKTCAANPMTKRQKFVFCFVVCIRTGVVSLKTVYARLLSVVMNVLCVFLSLMATTLGFLSDACKKFSVKPAPGSRLLAIADFLYRKETVAGVFSQIVADWRDDYFTALSEKRKWKVKWISICGHYQFYAAMLKQSPIGEFFEAVVKIVK